MKKKLPLIISMFLLLISIPVTFYAISKTQEIRKKAAPASTISLSPASQTVQPGETFSLKVLVDTNENSVTVLKLHLQFDSQQLSALSVTNDQMFPNILTSETINPGDLSMTVGVASTTSPVQGSGSAAIVNFQALPKAAGITTVSFVSDTYIGSIKEGSTNALVSSMPATVSITSDKSTVSDSSEPLFQPTISNTPTIVLTPTLTISPSASQSASFLETTSSGLITPAPTNTLEASESANLATLLLIESPELESTVQTQLPQISGKSAALATISVTISPDSQTITTIADDSGVWSVIPVRPLAFGIYTINVVSEDPISLATNTAESSFVVNNPDVTPILGGPVPVTGNPLSIFVMIGIGVIMLITGIKFFPL